MSVFHEGGGITRVTMIITARVKTEGPEQHRPFLDCWVDSTRRTRSARVK
jgi:hypothetical protein